MIKAQINTVQLQLDEARNRETTLKNNNRTLRDELRKVQSSVQLMEKSRNPGVGYWSAGGANSARATAGASTAPSTPAPNGSAAESVRSGGAGGDAGSAKEREPLGRRSTDSAAVAPAKQDEEEVNLEVSPSRQAGRGVLTWYSTSEMSSCNSWSTRRCAPTSSGSYLSFCASRHKSCAASTPRSTHRRGIWVAQEGPHGDRHICAYWLYISC